MKKWVSFPVLLAIAVVFSWVVAARAAERAPKRASREPLRLAARTEPGTKERHAEKTSKENRPLRLLLTYGGHAFEEKQFFQMFDAMPGVKYTKAPMPESAKLLRPGLAKDYDAIVMYDMVTEIPPPQQKAFVELLHEGIGLVSLHHNLAAHRNWDEFRTIIGGKYCFGTTEVADKKLRLQGEKIDGKKVGPSHYAHDQQIPVKVADKQHSITRGLADFTIHDEVYNDFYVAPDVHVLLTADHPKCDPKIAWTKHYGKSRVFYLMLGHDSQAWKHAAYPQLVLAGVHWAAGR